MKKVPVKDVPPADRLHDDEEKRPLGEEEIVHTAESPLLNCPVSVNVIVVPGGCGEAGEKAIAGALSMVKATIAESPVLPVTVIVVAVFAPTETPTVNEAVTFPPLMLQA